MTVAPTDSECVLGDSVQVYPATWRIAAGTLVVISRGMLLGVLALVLLADTSIPLAGLVRALAVAVLLPGLAAWLIARAFAAGVALRGPDLVLRFRDRQLEIPCAAIARVEAWAVPLPGPGVSLWMRSGRRYRVQARDPAELLAGLADHAGLDAARVATRHPSVVYAHALSAVRRRRWYHILGKFGVFALLPAAVFFNAHQHIAYGGLLGEYYLLGLGSYLETFGAYWATVSIYLILYASVWRALAEVVAISAARIAPTRATAVRRLAEIACRVLYFGGVPVLVGLRFLS